MTAPKVQPQPKCRYCKKRPDEHTNEDHPFLTRVSKTKAASNSFTKREIEVVRMMFSCAVKGQPLPAHYTRTKDFAGGMRKFNNMSNGIALAERLNKIGEKQDEQQTLA